MITTKTEFIKNHPKSKLARELSVNNWPEDTEIQIIGGLCAPHNKNSNLYKALQTAILKKYAIGGHRQHGTEGWWMAVA